MYLTLSHGSSIWTKFSLLEQQDRLKHVKRMVQERTEEEKEWSWWKLLPNIFGIQDCNKKHKAPKSYNIYKKSPDFKNNYGWSTQVDGSEYKPLKDTGIGILLVNLTAVINLNPCTKF